MTGVVTGVAIVLGSALAALATPAFVADKPVAVTVSFTLTDLQYRPIAAAPVRLVIGAPKGWQNPDSGVKFLTDADGEYAFRTTAVVGRRSKKVSSGFVSTRGLTADYLSVAAEFPYVQTHWLYAIDIYRFPDETNALLDPMHIFSRDSRGRFTDEAERIGGSWKIADLGGQMLTNAGYEPWEFTLHPDPSTKGWTMQIAFKKWPEPIRR